MHATMATFTTPSTDHVGEGVEGVEEAVVDIEGGRQRLLMLGGAVRHHDGDLEPLLQLRGEGRGGPHGDGPRAR